jgi:putative hemolysin
VDLLAAAPKKIPAALIKGFFTPLEQILAIDKINSIHHAISPCLDLGDFCQTCLNALNVNYSVTEKELAQIPETGPLVMMANHPFGGLEGIILAEVLLQIRPDVRILANYLLTRIPALEPKIIPVDPLNPKKAATANGRALKRALDWISKGGALLTFPAGEVSHWDPKCARVIDPPWSPHIANLSIKAKAKTLLVYVHGRNSVLFNLLGFVNPRLRTLMLPRELLNKSSSTIQLTMGKPIAWRKLADFPSTREAVEFLRFSTYLLKHRKEGGQKWKSIRLVPKAKNRFMEPIVSPVPKARLVREIQELPEENLLVMQKEFRVYLTKMDQSPGIMREIGRLREVSFRDVAEGTGKSLDIDTYDSHYLQLFLWNTHTNEIVGAYRMGCTDEILGAMGPRGLYSATLFHYKQGFLNRMVNALELGRSFIRTEYQKKFGCLALLWRGIGAFVARKTQYRYLFGPVSISQDYHAISKNLMVAFLQRHTLDPSFAPLVKPKRPVKMRNPINGTTPLAFIEKETIDDVSILVSEIEQDCKGVPTLIKHYLKLNGRFLAFNLDKDFANTIDGLIFVDLLKTEPKLVQRFLGTSGTRAFYDRHSPELSNEAA